MISLIFYPGLIVIALSLHLFLNPYLQPDILSLCVALFAIVVVAIAERIIPYKKEWNQNLNDFYSDFTQTNLIFPVLTRLSLVLTTLFAGALFSKLSLSINFWPLNWPILAQLFLALVVAEFFFYWIHWLSHRVGFLWKLHSIHHGAGRVYWANSARFHPIDAFLQLIIYLGPLAILGVPNEVLRLFLTLNVVTGLLEHANINFNAGLLNYFFNSAQLHRWHHSEIEETSKKNLGKVTCVWDLVFGTHYFPKNSQVGKVGLDKTQRAVPPTLFAQLSHPFKK